MRLLLLLPLLVLTAACGADTEPASDPPLAATTSAAETDMMDEGAMPTTPVSDAAMDAEIVSEGTFSGAGDHAVAGSAALYQLDDGSYSVRLEGLESDNGPDLKVWLVRDLGDKAADPIDLGDLKSTRGDQNYAVSASISPDDVAGVSIWCEQFSVEFGTAPLE